MTPLDAARQMNTETEPDEGHDHDGRRYFSLCGGVVMVGHAPDCPWLALPQIVAALEAAEHHIAHDDPGNAAGWDALAAALSGTPTEQP